MEKRFEQELLKAMKEFENKEVRITLSGIIESRIDIKNLRYILEDGILVIEGNHDNYVDINIDDIEELYFELGDSSYALLVLGLESELEIELITIEDNDTFIREKILEKIEELRFLEEILKQEVSSV